jgi:hypothetical protein
MNIFQARNVLETRLWRTFWFTQAEIRRDEVYQVSFWHSLTPLMLLVILSDPLFVVYPLLYLPVSSLLHY